MEKIANSDFQSVLTLAKETFFDQLSKYPRESYKKDILLMENKRRIIWYF